MQLFFAQKLQPNSLLPLKKTVFSSQLISNKPHLKDFKKHLIKRVFLKSFYIEIFPNISYSMTQKIDRYMKSCSRSFLIVEKNLKSKTGSAEVAITSSNTTVATTTNHPPSKLLIATIAKTKKLPATSIMTEKSSLEYQVQNINCVKNTDQNVSIFRLPKHSCRHPSRKKSCGCSHDYQRCSSTQFHQMGFSKENCKKTNNGELWKMKGSGDCGITPSLREDPLRENLLKEDLIHRLSTVSSQSSNVSSPSSSLFTASFKPKFLTLYIGKFYYYKYY